MISTSYGMEVAEEKNSLPTLPKHLLGKIGREADGATRKNATRVCKLLQNTIDEEGYFKITPESLKEKALGKRRVFIPDVYIHGVRHKHKVEENVVIGRKIFIPAQLTEQKASGKRKVFIPSKKGKELSEKQRGNLEAGLRIAGEKIKILDVSNLGIEDKDAKIIFQAHLPNLQTLNLKGNCLSDEFKKEIDALKTSYKIYW